MKDTRPVNLDLTKLKFPVTAIASILHRVSGVFVFILVLVVMRAFSYSLKSADAFAQLQMCFAHNSTKIMIWLFLAAIIYHFVAGIRHLLMDLGFGETLKTGRLTAWLAIIISIIFALSVGVWLWH